MAHLFASALIDDIVRAFLLWTMSKRMKPKAYLPFLLILSLITTCVEVDISVPSFPQIAQFFKVSDNLVQLTISLNFLGYCLGALAYGPLSDAFGRRKVMIIGNGVLALGAVACVIAPSMAWLLTARLIQGFGASTSVVVAFAMIADSYQGEKAMKLYGLTNACLSIGMAIAPLIGGFVNQAFGWRGNYATVAILGVTVWLVLLALLPETKETREPFSLKHTAGSYKQLLFSAEFMKTSLIPSVLFASYMAYIACSAFLYINTFGLSTMMFVTYQAMIVAAFAVPSLTYGRIVKFIEPPKAAKLGIVLCILSAVALVTSSHLYPANYALFTLFMCAFSVGFAICYPFIFNQSLAVFPSMYGAASSFIMSVRAALTTVFTMLAGAVFNGSALSVAIIVAVGIALASFLALRLFSPSQEKQTMVNG